ncbi:MAG TPA: hypothetical protein ENI23_13960 [bacterium]|nr:hypothetical protein [bacterium]
MKKLKLTPKQAVFLAGWLKTGNGVKSAMKAYDTEDYQSAKTIASQNLSKLNLDIRAFCEANGVSFKEIFDENKGMLGATKPFSSHTEADKNIPDWNARDKALTRFERWLGLGGKEGKKEGKIEVNVDNRTQYYVGLPTR